MLQLSISTLILNPEGGFTHREKLYKQRDEILMRCEEFVLKSSEGIF